MARSKGTETVFPSTAAVCTRCFASRGSRSIRAASTAWTVSGTATGVGGRPWSRACHANSSKKNGLPPALATISWRNASGGGVLRRDDAHLLEALTDGGVARLRIVPLGDCANLPQDVAHRAVRRRPAV